VGFSCAKRKISGGSRNIFFTFKGQVAIWLCGVMRYVPIESIAMNPGLQHKPRLVAEIF
jgi:hypothetical protein